MKIIIAGAGGVGKHLAKLLAREKQDITLMDEDEDRLCNLDNNFDLMTMNASPTSIEAQKEAGVANADLFIAVTPEETCNMTCCIIAKGLGAKKTVARIDNSEYLSEDFTEFFRKIGISSMIYPEALAAQDIVNGLKMSWVRQRWDVHDNALVLLGIKLRESCEILNEPLKTLCGPDTPYHVVAIKRGNDTLIPNGDDELRLFDLAYFMTTKQYIPFIRKMVGKEHYADVKNVMIMGGGKTSLRAVMEIPDYMNVKVIEQDEKRCERINELIDNRTMVINGDGRDLSLLIDEGIKNTQAFVALTGNAETNILACLTAKRLGVIKTIAMVENFDYVSMAESLDIGTLINKKTIAASHIYQMTLDADVDNVRFLMTANADVAEFNVDEDTKVTHKLVKDIGFPAGVTIGGLVRNGVGMLVSGNTQIEANDCVIVFCHEQQMRKIEKFFK
jgi:trk system potassium uptake protein TrkA